MSETVKPVSLRIDRLLSNLGYGSRREIHTLVKCGQVLLDQQPIDAADDHVKLTPDLAKRMMVEDEPLDPLPGMVVMLHKPLGVTCSHKDGGTLVYDLFPSRWRQRKPPLSSIGRLDKETSGLLLFTDDGALLHRIIAPQHNVAKRYFVTVAEPFSGHEASIFASGTLLLDDDPKPLLPVEMEVLSPTTAYVVLKEGRYHQVRRMFAAMGNCVTALHRDRIGQLSLPDSLAVGTFRLLTADELTSVMQ